MYKKARKIIIYLLIFCMFISCNLTVLGMSDKRETNAGIDTDTDKKIDQLIRRIQKKADVPGISVVILKDGEAVYKNSGYSNKAENVTVNENTYFEIGSMSKAFTGLAVLKLEDEGKISLDDMVTKYLPWFEVKYSGTHDGKKYDGNVELKLGNLLYHTSGIPFKTIGDIPVSLADDALEQTVRGVCGTKLDFYPGEKYQYATINYDILGLIIQKVSGISYEEYIQKEVLDELGLKHTYLYREDAIQNGIMASGYKYSFFQAREYDAPQYRGNKPAGYIISNAVDMQYWMRIQMGIADVSDRWKNLIKRSHMPDFSVNPSIYGLFYAGGWSVDAGESIIEHEGANPNFSGQIMMRPNDHLGVCILTNINSNAARYIAENILNLLSNAKVTHYQKDIYKTADQLFSVLLVVAVLWGATIIFMICMFGMDIKSGRRENTRAKSGKVGSLFVMLPLLLFTAVCVYYLPNVMFERLPWKAVTVWCSDIIAPSCSVVYAVFILFMFYVLLDFKYSKKKGINYITLVPLSLLNGLASAMIIFIINESMNRNLTYSKELLPYFIFALLYFVYTIKLLQGKLIVITNEIAYQKRESLISAILSTSYENIVRIGKDKIFTGLNNDCTAISELPRVIVRILSDSLTLIFCLFYLSSMSIIALAASLGIIIVAALLSIITSKLSVKYWKENRTVQDKFFGQISDMVLGFKELTLNKIKRIGFWKEINNTSMQTMHLNQKASLKFLDFHLYNTTMYNMIFGLVVFIFPLVIVNYDLNLLRENLLVVFYMITPFNSVINSVSEITHMSVNIRRIDTLLADLKKDVYQDLEEQAQQEYPKDQIKITFDNVEYRYPVNEAEQKADSEFALGPVNLEFNSGEITFITGGNGSGKSTVAKLISGLFIQNKGVIRVNEKEVTPQQLNQLFSSVYSDFYLFQQMYGMNYDKNEAEQYLKLMKIEDKIKLEDGKFESIELSTGQSKRLAYVVSLLDHKPMMILDEWAAEQDPEFREYFYKTLLPLLKKDGKGVVLVTHDDRYFGVADKVIKMERGKVLEIIESKKETKYMAGEKANE